ncbi:MAG: PD-(D/E)XK nuclease family protein [Flavobacteriaceae bacterium]|nr:MAG: PD-(D/E)XK nuclease family protein [Flavobacteriaceae bacterium]
MGTFISETVEDILKSTDTFNHVVLILPSQRAGVYIKEALKNKIAPGFLPEILTIEQFVETVSGLKKADTLQLLFDFYTIYKDIENAPASFDHFSSWAYTVLQDFNEIDQYLIDTKDVFAYIRDIRRLKKWSVKGEFQETEFIKDHHSFLEKLQLYYTKLYTHLRNAKSGYQGLLYREATKYIDAYLKKNSQKKHLFIGFNAMNKAEEYLVQKVLAKQNADIYWDIDEQFFHSNHQAGSFIRKYTKEWEYYQKNTLKTIGTSFSSKKEINVIGASKNITQIKHAGEILDGLPGYNHTAFVLGDESLLPVALSSLPEKIHDINITMGYPLKNIPVVQLIYTIFKLFISQEKFRKRATNAFFYKDVLAIFKNAVFSNYVLHDTNFSDEIDDYIRQKNSFFLRAGTIAKIYNEKEEHIQKTIAIIFNPIDNVSDFLNKVLVIIDDMKEKTTKLEKEYLYRLYMVFTQLNNLQEKYQYLKELKTAFRFFKQLTVTEHLFFRGEPLKGLQLMGMLETRVLDFENIIITSVNEGILPNNKTANSFIPFDVRVHFNIPTYKEKEAVFSYHFFRLLQRAKRIFILYNTENEAHGTGEKSRFLKQLELIRTDIIFKNVSPKVFVKEEKPLTIEKDLFILDQLKMLAQQGISPSALTGYLYHPITFYKQRVLHLKEFETIEETITASTFGNIIHDVLDALYTPFVDQRIKEADIHSMLTLKNSLIATYFKKHFKEGTITTGKNRLIFEVVNRLIERFLKKELETVRHNQLKIIATEKQLEAIITVDALGFPIKIKGIIDRVDELNGTVRVIDYKTGIVKSSALRIGNAETIEDYKYSKSIQVLLYTYLYVKNKNFDFKKPIIAGIFSFKNLSLGLIEINFSEKRNGKDTQITQERLDDFMTKIKQLLLKIYDLQIPFEAPSNTV